MFKHINSLMESRWAIILTLLVSTVSAQPILSAVDSLPITRANQLKKEYNLNRTALGIVSFKSEDPINITLLQQKQNIGGSIVTLLTGLGTSWSEDAKWYWENELVSSNQMRSLRVPLIFYGEYNKERARVRNDDGSFSIETTKGIKISWAGAVGLMMQQGDTLGAFEIRRSPADSVSNYWLSRIEVEARHITKTLAPYEMGRFRQDFAINGIFNNQTFAIITGGNQYRSVILVDDRPIAVFQSHPVDYIIAKKKDRIRPYLLVEKNVSESQKDGLMMLGLMNAMLAQRVGIDFLRL
jgi:hypothetical protein